MNQQECIWMNKKPNGQVDIGFQQKYISEHLQEAFHILPANHSKIESGTPMMVVESNDGLENIRSPFDGRFVNFSDKARNFPDRLKETDVVLTLWTEEGYQENLKKVKKNPPKKVNDENSVADRWAVDFDGMNFGAMELVAPAVQPNNLNAHAVHARAAIRQQERVAEMRRDIGANPPIGAGFFGQQINDFIWNGANWIRFRNV